MAEPERRELKRHAVADNVKTGFSDQLAGGCQERAGVWKDEKEQRIRQRKKM